MSNSNIIREAFDAVHMEDSLKRSTKAFICERTRSKPRLPHIRQFATVFACIIIVVLGIGGWNIYTTPVSAISVDVNPSVELGVNRFDRVVSVESYNDDGAVITASVNLKNLKYTDALDVLFSSEAMAPYMENDALVCVTVIGEDAQKGEEMYSQISARQYQGAQNFECCLGSREEVDTAHEAGLSFGKYRVFLELQALDPKITADEIRDWTMRQIKDRIAELSNGSEQTQSGNRGKGPRI